MKGSGAAAQDAAAPVKQYSAKLISQTLDILSTHTRSNPDYLLALTQFPRIALESPSPSGGKFWLGVAMETGVSVRWGKLGTQGTVKHFPLTHCFDGDPSQELKRRVLEKINKGYDIIPHETILP